MKRTLITAMVFAASAALGSAAHAQGAHNHGTPKPGADATQGHDAHCCKPDAGDMKGMQGMGEHDYAQVHKKPATKSAKKAASEKGATVK